MPNLTPHRWLPRAVTALPAGEAIVGPSVRVVQFFNVGDDPADDRVEQPLAASEVVVDRHIAEARRAAGFAATNLDDIAADAGISRAILYRRFESNTDLYRAVLDSACQRLISPPVPTSSLRKASTGCSAPLLTTPPGSGSCSTTPPANPNPGKPRSCP